MSQLFEAQVKRTPDQIAVVIENETLTYDVLNKRANQLAAYLNSLEFQPNFVVGVCLEKSPDFMISILGILKAGGVYLPLDPTLPAERLAFMLKDASPRILLTQASLKHPLRLTEQFPDGLIVAVDGDLPEHRAQPAQDPKAPSCISAPAYIIYTSGSTGRPKGVLIEHPAIAAHCQTIIDHYALTPRDRVLQFASMGFDTSLEQILPALLTGATVVMPKIPLMAGADFHQFLHRERLTVVNLPPAYWRQWLTAFDAEETLPPLPDLRLVICGGEAMPPAVLTRWQRSPLQSCQLLNAYGPTETTITALTFDVPPDRTFERVPIGRPLGRRAAYVLDAHRQPVPVGQTGELYLGGEGLAKGYLNRPRLTRERFITCPVKDEPEKRLYKTGDLARQLPDGQIEFLGRSDRQVKLRGFRIELGEVETVLQSHGQVEEAVVKLCGDTPEHAWLAAYVVPHLSPPLEDELRSCLSQTLPDYMMPAAFVFLDGLPLTPNGKVDRQALPIPDINQRLVKRELNPPRTLTEIALAQIWCDLLTLEKVGIHENFFELGGHSLLATQAVSRIRAVLSAPLLLRQFFETPTIAQLAAAIARTITPRRPRDTSIQPVKGVDNFPLSYAQQRLWFLHQLQDSQATYTICQAFELRGTLNTEALQGAIAEIVRRHDVLRTNIKEVEEGPVQVVAPHREVRLAVIDLTAASPHDVQAEANQLMQVLAQKPFDLSSDSLLRATLLAIDSAYHVLLITVHHSIADGWSLGVFIRELWMLYSGWVQGTPPRLEPLPIQYADFAHWQRRWLQGEILGTQLTYWRQQLAGSPPRLELPTDYPRPPVQTFEGQWERCHISTDLTQQLKNLGNTHDATLYMVLLAAFQVLLYRYSGQTDLIVGTPIANRNRPELEPLIGFFVNTLALRADLSNNPDFRTFLDQVRLTTLDAYTHQDLPFERIVDELQLERHLSYPPLVQVMFVLQNTPLADWQLPELALRSVDIETHTAKFDLTLVLTETAQGLSGYWEYNTALFQPETIRRMAGHFQALLESIVAKPQQGVAQLPLLTAAERRQQLVSWNDTTTDYPHNTCIHHLFEAQTARSPDAIAVVFQDHPLTYRQLNQRANQLAHYLQTLGVGPEVCVGICLERSLEMIISLLAVLKAGGAYVPLDPEYPPERLAFILSDAAVPVLLTHSRLQATLLEPIAAQLADQPPQVIALDTAQARFSSCASTAPKSAVGPTGLAYIIYTSGSTGQPKGVMIEHRGLCNLALAKQRLFQLRTGRRCLQSFSLSFDGSVWDIFPTLTAGATLYLVPKEQLLGGESFADWLAQAAINTLTLSPSLLATVPYRALPHLDTIAVAGEACPLSLAQQWSQGRRCFNAYGPTEATVCATVAPVTPAVTSLTIGTPIENVQVYVLDAHHQLVPMGVPGELYIGGEGLARGYRNQPQRTAERFIPCTLGPEQPAQRLYKTGDLVRYRPDGQLEFLGRIDHQVKIRGFRIELAEIEAALQRHPHLQEAVVVVDGERDRPEDSRLVAYGIPQPGHSLTPSELRLFLKQTLPEYMVPPVFLLLDSLPLTPNGKVDRRALPKPDALTQSHPLDRALPQTPMEKALATIWGDLLQLDTVGRDDNFFELGGHSLLATQVVSRMRRVLAVELPLRQLFERPTIAELAGAIAASAAAPPDRPIPPVNRAGELPLSFAQQRLWLLNQLEGPNATYNIPIVWQAQGRLQLTALEQTVAAIQQRHEGLRTTFRAHAGVVHQQIQPHPTVTVTVIDLRSLPQPEQDAQRQARIEAEIAHPFDLAQDCLIRVTVLQLQDTQAIIILNLHHIVADGWSIEVLQHEFCTLYPAFAQGLPPALAPLPIQYADFAHWQRQWLQGAVLETHLTYWQQQLAGSPPRLALPTDYPRPPQQTFEGGWERFDIGAELTQQLKHLGNTHDATLFMVLLAAFQVLLSRYSGQTDLMVGCPIANRNRAELEPLIGFFVNTLALRADLSGNPAFITLLQQVRQTTLDAYTHQDLPFERIVDELKLARDLSYPPLVQVMLVLQNTPLPTLSLPELTLQPVDIETHTAKFDLTLTLAETEAGLAGYWEYNTALFVPDTMQRMTEHFQTLLAGIVADPGQGVAQLPLLTPAERHRLLVEWNDTATDYSREACIHHLFEAQAARSPDAIAVIFADQHLTYRQLNQRANQLAHHLQTLGVGPAVLVGICLERSLEMIISVLAVLKAGGAYVPLDPEYPAARLTFIVKDAGIYILLTQRSLQPKVPESQAQVVCLEAVNSETACLQNLEGGDRPASATDLAYVIYTSGSTGTPKGVPIPHGNAVNLLQSIAEKVNFTAQDTVLAVTTLAFDISVAEIFLPLTRGAKLVVASRAASLDGSQLLQLMHTHQPTFMQPTPATWRLLLAVGWTGTPNLQMVSTGEPLPQDLARQLLPRGNALWNLYGPTETTIWSAAGRVQSDQGPITIGKPIANTQLYILDAYLQPVPIGITGELYIGGDGLTPGYLNRPELTAEKFITHPFGQMSSDRLYKTGDLARWLPTGQIECLGRTDHQVKIRGCRIELGDIEAALKQHPDIQQAVAVAHAQQSDYATLVAYWVAKTALSTEVLRSFLRSRLPDYMVPSIFMPLEALPLTPNGKIDRRALPAPERPLAPQEAPAAIPQTALELQILQICRQVLTHPGMGLLDNFFDAGGNSLLAVRFCAEVESRLHCVLPITTLFQTQTIRDIAEQLHHSCPVRSSALAIIKPTGTATPVWFINSTGNARALSSRLGPEFPFYNLNIFGIRPVLAAELKQQRSQSVLLPAIAAQFIQDLRTVQPQGPYQLVAYCQDGPLALEMAQQLQQQGEDPPLLCLIDSLFQHYRPKFWHYGYTLKEFGWRYLGFKRRQWWSWARSHPLTSCLKALITETSTAQLSQAERRRLSAKVHKDEAFYADYLQAVEHYQPQPYLGKIVLLMSSQWRFESLSQLQNVALTNLDIRIVKGLHNALFEQPYIDELTETLQAFLATEIADETP